MFADDVAVYLNGKLMTLYKMYTNKQESEFYLDVLTYVRVPDIQITTSPALTAPSFGESIVNPTITHIYPDNLSFKPNEEYSRWEDEWGYSLPGIFNKKYVKYSVWLDVSDSDYWGLLDYTDTKAYINGDEAEIAYHDSSSVHIQTPVYDTGGVHVEVIRTLKGSGYFDNYVSLNGVDWDSSDEADYAKGGTVTLYAKAAEGCSFVEWRKDDSSTGELLGTDPVITVTVTDDTTFWAVFDKDVPATGKLTDTVDYTFDEATGTVTLIPTGADGKGSAYLNYYDDNPLYGNMRIKHVVIQEGITDLNWVFRNNDNIETVYIPASMKYIYDSAFDDSRIYGDGFTVHPDNPEYASNGDGNLYNKQFSTMIRYAQGKGVTEYEIPDGVTIIARQCFVDIDLDKLTLKNEGLELFDYAIYGGRIDHLVIEEGVKDLGDYSGFTCKDTVRYLPSTLADVGTQNDIIDASNLEAFSVAEGDYYTSINGILYEYYNSELKDELTLWKYPLAKSGDSYTTPAGVTRVEWIAINSVVELKNIVFSEEVIKVANSSIRYMDDITVTFENPECEISNSAIGWCNNVTIKGLTNSTAQYFAENNNFTFIGIGDTLGKMDPPTNLRWEGEIACWDPVEGATRYEVYFFEKKEGSSVRTLGPYYINYNMDNPSIEYPEVLLYKNADYYFTVSAQRTLYEASDPVTSPIIHGRYTLKKPEFSINDNILTITPYIGDDGEEADNYYIWFLDKESGSQPSVLSGFRLYGEHTIDLQKLFDEKNVGGAIPYGDYRISFVAHKIIYGWEMQISELSDEIIWNYSPATATPTKMSFVKSLYAVKIDDTTSPMLKMTPANSSRDITWTSSKPSVASVDENGNVTGHKVGTVTITATSKKDSKVKASCTVYVYFKDVTPSDIQEGLTENMCKYIYWGVDNSVINGFDDGYFRPFESCTRAQFCIMLWKMMGRPEPDPSNPRTFSDIGDLSANFQKAIQWAASYKYVNGYDNGTFNPNGEIIRRDLVIILWKVAGRPNPDPKNIKSFSDIGSLSANFQKAINWASSYGIVNGYSDGTFGPENQATRAQLITMLYRYNKSIVKKLPTTVRSFPDN